MITLSKSGTLKRLAPTTIPGFAPFDFHIGAEHEAGEPPEARGLARDEVRLLVSYRSTDRIVHTRFRDIPRFLEPGDVLVINTSGTLSAAVDVRRTDGMVIRLHLSTHLPADLWLVELRLLVGASTEPFRDGQAGETLRLPAGATATLLTPYRHVPEPGQAALDSTRLWVARLDTPDPLVEYLNMHGSPIQYGYVKQKWPAEYYQTVYATEPGSAEMPSAGRAFTPEILTRLVARGIQIAPLLLHTGVASLENHEPPYEEYYRVSLETARTVNNARQHGKRVVAVGTTAVRALETVSDKSGITHPGKGWTREIITPQRGLRAIDALLTGFHEPRATHLAMLETLAGIHHLEATYSEALREQYLWHEFGDLHLILP